MLLGIRLVLASVFAVAGVAKGLEEMTAHQPRGARDEHPAAGHPCLIAQS